MSVGNASEAKFAPPLPRPRYRSNGSEEWRVGLSHAAITEEGLHLLVGVETYLLETRAVKLSIMGRSRSFTHSF